MAGVPLAVLVDRRTASGSEILAGALKYEFHVRPGARVSDIRLAYAGATGLALDARGALRIRTGLGVLRGYMVSDKDDVMAEAFAVGAMQYSFLDADAPRTRREVEDDVSPSAFGEFLKRTGSCP